MTVIRDRRQEAPNDKYGTDKERFRLRYKAQIKKAIQNHVSESSIQDIGTKGISIPIPKEMTHEPIFHHAGAPDSFRKVFPGNVSFDVGDRINKPPSGSGKGDKGDPSADAEDSEDSFIWVSEEEVLDLLFEGRSLPDMTKLAADHVKIMTSEPSGHTNKGPSHRMDMAITNKKRKEESLVLSKTSERRILANLSEQFNILASHAMPELDAIDLDGKAKSERFQEITRATSFVAKDIDVKQTYKAQQLCDALTQSVTTLKTNHTSPLPESSAKRLQILENRLADQFKIQQRSNSYQDQHLTYEYDDDVPVPSAKAVMFCLMDISGSMGQEEKNTAKSFFWLMNKFLKARYDEVDIVYISHTTTAKEVDEETFFHSKETGGTVVSTCIEETLSVIKKRYSPAEWNIYSAQASDGDNVQQDNPVLIEKLEDLLPLVQAHYYLEVHPASVLTGPSDILGLYEDLQRKYPDKMKVQEDLRSPEDALEAFKKFFPVNGTQEPVSALNAYL